SEMIKQVESEAMPPGRRPKVPEAERKVLRDWIAAGAPPFAGEPSTPPEKEVIAEANRGAQVKEILRIRCLECHGGTRTNGGFKILDMNFWLPRKKKFFPGNPDGSILFQLTPAQDESIMPPAGQPPLSPQEVETVRLWIAEGAPPFPPDVSAPPE